MNKLCIDCGNSTKFIDYCKAFPPQVINNIAKCHNIFYPGELHICTYCGLGQRLPMLTDRELQTLYKHSTNTEHKWRLEENPNWLEAKKVIDNTKKEKLKVLDIGCNSGIFLSSLNNKIEKFAVEPDLDFKEIITNNNINYIGQWIDNIPEKYLNHFDYICLFDVFEHLNHPSEMLIKIKLLLAENGKIIISTGNINSWPWKLLKGNYSYLDSPQHIVFASEYYFKKSICKTGLKIHKLKKTNHRNFKSSVFKEISNTLFFWNNHKNFPHNILRRFILSLPNMDALKHKKSPPMIQILKDHLLVILKNK